MLGGISIWQLLIVLAIVILLFGTKRLKSVGSDLGSAIKGFRKAVGEDEKTVVDNQSTMHNTTIDGTAKKVEEPATKE